MLRLAEENASLQANWLPRPETPSNMEPVFQPVAAETSSNLAVFAHRLNVATSNAHTLEAEAQLTSMPAMQEHFDTGKKMISATFMRCLAQESAAVAGAK